MKNSFAAKQTNVSLAAQELGICKESLVNWRKLHKEGKLTKEKQISSDPNKRRVTKASKGT